MNVRPVVFSVLFLLTMVVVPTFSQANAVETTSDTLSLSRAYELVLEQNENVQQSRQDVESAQEDRTIARSELLPEFNLFGEVIGQKQSSQFGTDVPGDEVNYGVVGRQSIYQGGSVWEGLDVAENRLEQQRKNFFRDRQNIMFDMATRYYTVLLTRRSVEIAESALRRARDQLRLAEGRFEAGVVTKTALLRARVDVADAREQLQRARNDFDVTRESLAVELGIDNLDRPLKEVRQDTFRGKSMSHYESVAMDKRRDLERASLEVEAQQGEVEIERADWWPDLDAVARYERYEEEFFRGDDQNWQFTLDVSYPLFNGFRDSSEIQKAREQKKQSQQALERRRREIRLEVREAFLDVRTQRSVIESLEEQMESARQNFEQVQGEFEAGVTSSVDVTDALTALTEAELRLAQARYQLQIDLLALKLATGEFQENMLAGLSPKGK